MLLLGFIESRILLLHSRHSITFSAMIHTVFVLLPCALSAFCAVSSAGPLPVPFSTSGLLCENDGALYCCSFVYGDASNFNTYIVVFSFLRRYFTSKRVMPFSILIEYGAHPRWWAKRLSWKGWGFGVRFRTSRGRLIILFIIVESKIISQGRWTGSGHRRRTADLRYLKSLFVL